MVLAMTKIYLQHTMRYLVVLVAIGLAAADDGPCFSHVAVRYFKDPEDNLCFEQCPIVPIMMVRASPTWQYVFLKTLYIIFALNNALFVLIIVVFALLLHVAVRQCSLIRSVDNFFDLKIQKKPTNKVVSPKFISQDNCDTVSGWSTGSCNSVYGGFRVGNKKILPSFQSKNHHS